MITCGIRSPLPLRTLSSLLAGVLTENGLYRQWEKDTSPFSYRDWQGRISHLLTSETVEEILTHFFSSHQSSFFSHFYQSDYKKTYRGKNLLPDGKELYLKYYRVSEAPLRIRMRNIFRRSLARKGFNLYFPLREKGIHSVCPLFYVRKKKGWIPAEAIYASYASDHNETLDHLSVEKLGMKKWSRLLMDLGGYTGELMAKGVLYGELYRNLIPIDRGDRWEFLLCDLDEMRSLSEKREMRKLKHLERFKGELARVSDLAVFDQAFWKGLQAFGQKDWNIPLPE